ncbi:D-glycero-beta-D-manno-heptose 1-phosphate adenylyltransferase [Haloferula chungangensis]|uniref:D-glycero-beta-D-manno-heptose 1-phosphate adenylyltransferase n=1 Tax=Haloferula chungangensis TaxID=1048331 RepID=A0ABW2L5Q6_9BACT
MQDIEEKIKSREEAAELLEEFRKDNKCVVFTNGCFDVLHPGHVQYLQASRKLGDILVVGLNSDDSIKRLKGSERPICEESARAYMLASMACVDMVVVFDEDTPVELMGALRPDILVKGADWEGKELPGSDLVGRVEFMKFLEGWSSTDVIGRIKKALQSELG